MTESATVDASNGNVSMEVSSAAAAAAVESHQAMAEVMKENGVGSSASVAEKSSHADVGKRKRKSSSLSEGKAGPTKRTITSRTLKKFSERELRDGLEYLVKTNQVPKRPELGQIKKLNKEALVKYCQSWAMANYYQAVLQQREVREKSAPVISPKQAKIIHRLKKHSGKNIAACVKNLQIDVKNMYSMKKEDLITAIALGEHGKQVLEAVREMDRKQEEERVKAKLEKKDQAGENGLEASSDESSDSDASQPKKKKKKMV